ncbi:hypothetical protein [Anaerobutyricum soehngenii]|uniref:hypothetical protein n=1 Tax=Anaerobutyricum soehngenii TaxID=105843 RepID=UPI001C100873|nr:hypothetical protein [Anaerobutyricum soehngenii]MBU5416405.1 hypothetical protein [Anaerobutyricum soehngenii]
MQTLQYIVKTSKQKIMNTKMIIFCCVFLLLSWTYDQPYLQFIHEKQYPITWCIFPFYMSAYAILAVFYLGIVYIHSDVPFMQYHNMYQVIRTGRLRWVVGQIGGIICRSFFAVIVTAIGAILPFAGNLEWSNNWGKLAKTLSMQGIEKNFGFAENSFVDFRFFYEIMQKKTPLELMTHTVLVCTLICSFLGILMFVLSLYISKMIAVAGALASIVAFFIVQNIYGKWKLILAHFVPTYWAEIALSATPVSGRYRMPSLLYIYLVLIICIILMAGLLCYNVKDIEFNWENEEA